MSLYRFDTLYRGVRPYLSAIDTEVPTAHKTGIDTLLDNALHDYLKKLAFGPLVVAKLVYGAPVGNSVLKGCHVTE